MFEFCPSLHYTHRGCHRGGRNMSRMKRFWRMLTTDCRVVQCKVDSSEMEFRFWVRRVYIANITDPFGGFLGRYFEDIHDPHIVLRLVRQGGEICILDPRSPLTPYAVLDITRHSKLRIVEKLAIAWRASRFIFMYTAKNGYSNRLY